MTLAYARARTQVHLGWPQPPHAAPYRDALARSQFLASYLQKRAALCGATVPVYQPYPLSEWRFTTRLVE